MNMKITQIIIIKTVSVLKALTLNMMIVFLFPVETRGTIECSV